MKQKYVHFLNFYYNNVTILGTLLLQNFVRMTDFWQFLPEWATDEAEKLMGKTRYVIARHVSLYVGEPVRGIKNAPIDLLLCTVHKYLLCLN